MIFKEDVYFIYLFEQFFNMFFYILLVSLQEFKDMQGKDQ